MQSSFEVLEWGSICKEEDSLVHLLFGDISDSTATNRFPVVSGGEDPTPHNGKGSKLFSKKERRKASNINDESKVISKKKQKDKTYQKLNSQLKSKNNESEHTIDCTDKVYNGGTEKSKKKRKNRSGRNKFKTDPKSNCQLTESRDQLPESTINSACDESVNFVKVARQKATCTVNSTNQVTQAANVDSKMPSNAEFEVENEKSSNESIGLKRKKAKKNKGKEKSKDDDDVSDDDSCEPSVGQSTLEINHEHKRRKTKSKEEQDHSEPAKNHTLTPKDRSVDIVSVSVPQNKSSLHEKMTKQLESSRFRRINEQLYTTTGDEAVAMFSDDPSLFDVYHRGFTNQVKLWPVNPVDKIIEWLKKRPTSNVVADFGCGEAVIAQSVANTVHSFDLVAKNKFVTACNMAKVPLNPASVDTAVFCLSLMGTNLVDFLREAHRVLKPGGVLKIAEVTSRINDTTEFVMSLSRLGFKLQTEDTSNKMFVMFDFTKDKESVKTIPSHKLEGLKLKPCIYKKR